MKKLDTHGVLDIRIHLTSKKAAVVGVSTGKAPQVRPIVVGTHVTTLLCVALAAKMSYPPRYLQSYHDDTLPEPETLLFEFALYALIACWPPVGPQDF